MIDYTRALGEDHPDTRAAVTHVHRRMNRAVSRTAPTSPSASHSINTRCNFQVTQDGATPRSLSYGMWFNTIANPTSADDSADEVMIWPYRSGGAGPAGTLQVAVTIAGTTWQIYRSTINTLM